jgi:hypothetical protein
MRKPMAVVLFTLVTLISCSRINLSDEANQKRMSDLKSGLSYDISISVDTILFKNLPEIFIIAKGVEIDRDKNEITVKAGALLSNVEISRYYLIRLDNDTKFSLPLGGRITIRHGNSTETIEKY